MTRILFTADGHPGKGANLYPGRLAEQEAALQACIDLAHEHDAELILHGGDFTESRHPTAAERAAFVRPLASARIPIVGVLGNHDVARPGLPTAPELVRPGLMRLSTRPELIDLPDLVVATLPWTPVSRLVASQNGGARDDTNLMAAQLLVETARGLRAEARERFHDVPCVLLGHWTVSGWATPTGMDTGAFGDVVLPLPDIEALGFDAVLLGHIHKPGIVSDLPGVHGPIVYAGSPLPLDFGEASCQHGCWLIDIEPGRTEATFLPIPGREFETLNYHFDQISLILTDNPWSAELPLADRIVRCRYEVTEEQAARVTKSQVEQALLRAGAHHAVAEPTIIRQSRARVQGLTAQAATPMDALDAWLRVQDPPLDPWLTEGVREWTRGQLAAIGERADATASGAVRPVRIEATNLGSWADLDFTFPEGACAVTGAIGSGKTTICASLDLCLFAKKGELATFIRDGEKQVEVCATLEHGGELYRVRRGAGKKSYLDFEKCEPFGAHNEAEFWTPLTLASQPETQTLIEQTLGLTRDTFRASAYLGQEADALAAGTSKALMDLFTALLHLGLYETLKERASAELRPVVEEIATVSARLATLQEAASEEPVLAAEAERLTAVAQDAEQAAREAQKRRDDLAAEYQAAHALTAAVDAARAVVAEADADHRALAAITAGAEQARDQLAAIASQRAQLEHQAATVTAIEAEQTRAGEQRHAAAEQRRQHQQLVQRATDSTRKHDQAREQARVLDAKAVQLQTRALDLDTADLHGDTETCDRCGQELHADARARARQSYLDESATLVGQIAALVADADTWHADAEAATSAASGMMLADGPTDDEVRDLTSRLTRARTAQLELAGLDQRASLYQVVADADTPEHRRALTDAALRLTAAQDTLADARAAAPTADRIEIIKVEGIRARAAHIDADERLKQAAADTVRAQERHARAQQAARQADTLVGQLAALHQRRDILARCEQAHGRTGVPAIILENHTASIERDAEQILSDLGKPGLRVEIRTLRETLKGEQRAQVQVTLTTDRGYERPFARWSGGQRMLIDFALRWAIVRNLGIGFLILDEPAAALDADARAAFLQVIEYLAGQVGTLLVVSHTAELREAIPQTIVVELDADEASRIVGVAEALAELETAAA